MDDIVRVEHVSNYYFENDLGIFAPRRRRQVLRDIDLTIRRDEFFGIVGESGCGKSTLAGCILGLLPFEGRIEVAGMTYSRSDRRAFARHVQAVFQDPLGALDPRRTIGDTMREPLVIHGIGTRKEQDERVRQMLETVGLDASYALRRPRELSGGQRQRVCIGAALMLEPELIVADEAISALDVSVGAQILNLFRKIHEEKEFAMLFISHNLNVVHYLCDRIAVLYLGRIVETGDAGEIYRHPAHPYTRILLDAIPDLTAGGTGAHPHGRPDEADPRGRRGEADHLPAAAKDHSAEAQDGPEDACPFCGRCPHVSDRCRSAVPELKSVSAAGGPEHLVRCFLCE